MMAQAVFNCEKCIFCRKRRSTELAMRCVLHASLYEHNAFVTLTYDEKLNGYHNRFNYTDIQKFKKRLRRHFEYYHRERIHIFNVHEYGTNGKKHWHLIIFNCQFRDRELFTTRKGNRLYTSKLLGEKWPFGHHTIGSVTEASAMYQAQYTQKDFKYGHKGTLKNSHSYHSGIGRDYFLIHFRQILQLGYVPFAGRKMAIPRYFRKLAHKHYSFFYAQENFVDTPQRKKLYSKFKCPLQARKSIAESYKEYSTQREQRILELNLEWEQFIQDHVFTNEKTDFEKSAENYLYDLKNKTGITIF